MNERECDRVADQLEELAKFVREHAGSVAFEATTEWIAPPVINATGLQVTIVCGTPDGSAFGWERTVRIPLVRSDARIRT